MIVSTNLREFWQTLTSNGVRSFLNLFSVAVSAASVVTVITISIGFSKELERLNFGKAAREISITENFYVDDRFGAPTYDDWRYLDARLGEKVEASTVAIGSRYYARFQTEYAFGMLIGVMGDYGFGAELELIKGMSFSASEIDSASRLCVLGQTTADELGATSPVLGEQIRVNQSLCKVIGIVTANNSQASIVNNSIYMPFGAFRRTSNEHRASPKDVDTISFFVRNEQDRPSVQNLIDETMRERHGAPAAGVPPFIFTNKSMSFAALKKQRQTLSLFLVSLGAVSLIVGVFGVSNSMLATVNERKKEIGVRMAIGATPSDIRDQFIVEACLITGIGSVAGGIVGTWVSFVIGDLTDWPVVVSWQVFAVTAITALVSGVAAGVYPAIKAAHMPPASAIRDV